MALDPDPALKIANARKRSRALVMAVLLGAFVVLLYAITIAKMTVSVQ